LARQKGVAPLRQEEKGILGGGGLKSREQRAPKWGRTRRVIIGWGGQGTGRERGSDCEEEGSFVNKDGLQSPIGEKAPHGEGLEGVLRREFAGRSGPRKGGNPFYGWKKNRTEISGGKGGKNGVGFCRPCRVQPKTGTDKVNWGKKDTLGGALTWSHRVTGIFGERKWRGPTKEIDLPAPFCGKRKKRRGKPGKSV